MNLDSVRELKLSLTASLLPRIETTITSRSAFGQVTGPVERIAEAARTVAPTGRTDFRLAVRVQQRAFEGSREVDLIKKQAKGEVDVRYVGRVMKLSVPWYQQRQRPLLIGCSIGHFNVTAGTLGCFVKRRTNGGVCILSNNHVLANENRGKMGDAIVQCGVYDGGQVVADTVAKLQDFVRLKRHGRNTMDCAIAALDGEILADLGKLRGVGKLAGLGDAFLDEGDLVTKIDRTTGLTKGRLTAFELDNVVVGFTVGTYVLTTKSKLRARMKGHSATAVIAVR